MGGFPGTLSEFRGTAATWLSGTVSFRPIPISDPRESKGEFSFPQNLIIDFMNTSLVYRFFGEIYIRLFF